MKEGVRVNLSELLHVAFLAKAARSKEKLSLGLNGREKLSFLEAVFQAVECMAGKRSSAGNTSGGSQSHLPNSEETRFAKSCDAVDKNEGKSTAENPLDTKASARIVVPGYADPGVLDIRRDSPTACREAISVLLAISASKGREEWILLTQQACKQRSIKGGFQDKDRVLFCWLATQERPRSPRSSAWQFVAHFERSFWIE